MKYLKWALFIILPLWLLNFIMHVIGYELMFCGITTGTIGFVLMCGIVLVAGIFFVSGILLGSGKWSWKLVRLLVVIVAILFVSAVLWIYAVSVDFEPRYTVLEISGDDYEQDIIAVEEEVWLLFTTVRAELYTKVTPNILKRLPGGMFRESEGAYAINNGDYEARYDKLTEKLYVRVKCQKDSNGWRECEYQLNR